MFGYLEKNVDNNMKQYENLRIISEIYHSDTSDMKYGI